MGGDDHIKMSFFSAKDVKSAVAFYKRYRDMPINKLRETKEYGLFLGSKEEIFDRWLFDYCFADVIE